MRSRGDLHKSKLGDFRIYLESFGWIDEPTKGDYEVLRMKHPKYKGKLLIYTKLDAKEHYTLHDIAYDIYRKWKRERSNV